MGKTLDELILEEKRSYFKKWRSENKDKVKNHNANYWKRKTEQKLNSARGSGNVGN